MFIVDRDERYARNAVTREDKPLFGFFKEFYNIEIYKMPRDVAGFI